MSQVLIASCSLDEPTWGPVVSKLSKRGIDPFVYEADKVADGTVRFSIQIGSGTNLEFRYNDRKIHPKDFAAAWYRRPNIFGFLPQTDVARHKSLDTERKLLQHSLWELIDSSKWLNHPDLNRKADHKLIELKVAKELGFAIPDTIVANHWDIIQKQLPEDIILKMVYGETYKKDEMRVLYTHPLKNNPHDLPLRSNPFPGIWQPFIPKRREWRITVVDDRFFDAAVYTDKDAKSDWRKPATSHAVKFKREKFPDDLKEKCLLYLNHFQLRYGAFDFIETPDGQIIFLECNPNGQFMWLEEELGFDISGAIAETLAMIVRA